METEQLTNNGLAIIIGAIGLVLLILAVINLRSGRRVGRLLERETQLRTVLDQSEQLRLAQNRSLNLVRQYARNAGKSGNTVYRRVAADLSEIVDDSETAGA